MSNPTNKYVTPVGLQQPAAADLSDGTTGTGAVVEAVSPVLSGTPTAPTASSGTNTTQLATTAFVTTAVTNAIAGVNPAVAVQAATATILPNSPTYLNGVSGIGATITAGVTNTTLVVDGYTPSLNDRILVKNESGGGGLGAGKNGVYFVSQIASVGLAWVLTRAVDYDQPSDINGTGAIPVINGTANSTTQWVLTSFITAVDGTQALTYAQFSANPATLAPINSPAFTGTPTAPTPSAGDSSTKIATTAFAATLVSGIDTIDVNGSAVVSPFSFTALVNGIGPVGEVEVNGFPVANYKPCMIEQPGNLANSQRTFSTVYQNNTGFPILVRTYMFQSSGNVTMTAVSDSSPNPSTVVNTGVTANVGNAGWELEFFVMPNNFYKISASSGTPGINHWREFICQNGTLTKSSDLAGSTRSLTTIYQNNSVNTLFVSVQVTGVSTNSLIQAFSDTSPKPTNLVNSNQQTSSSTGPVTMLFIVPPFHYYQVTAASGSLSHWYEYTWNIPCTKSSDMVQTTGLGQTRTAIPTAQSIDTSGSTITVAIPVAWINTDPFRVRWVVIMTQNTNSTNQCVMRSGDGIPCYQDVSQVNQSHASVPRTAQGPVLPNKSYSIFDLSGTGTYSDLHWWEYQLG